MKVSGSQRKLYLLALALLMVAVALVCAWTLWGGWEASSDAVVAPSPRIEADPAAEPTVSPDALSTATPTAAPAPSVQTMSTVVYYQDNYGYLVPVMRSVAYQDGIAKATLQMMVQSPENDMNAARLGLRTVLPEGTTFDLDIHDGLARIDLSEQALQLNDAAEESNMVSAIVQALTEFDSVERVEFLIGGQKREKLPHGTDISKTFTRGELNLETAAGVGEGLEPVMLYFPCESGSVVVPVTRMVYSDADVNTAVLELAKGPGAQSALEAALPQGCGLIGVSVENGVAKVNFTEEFADLVQNSDGGRLALRALVLTCTQFEGVDSVEILVEGQPYDPGEGTLAVPSFANVASEIENAYIQTQASLIFDYE